MATGLLILIVFAAAALAVYALLSSVFSDEVVVSKTLKSLDAYEVDEVIAAEPLVKPFADRIIMPFYDGFANLVKHFSPKEIEDTTKFKLMCAGNPLDMDVDKFLALKIVSIIVSALFITVMILQNGATPLWILIGIILIPGSYLLPDIWLRNLMDKRQIEIRLALPDTLDLLTISVEAGLGFDIALAKVVKNYPGPLAEEFSRMLHEVQVGVTRNDALKSLADRTNVDELRNFIAAIIQAEVFGVSIGNVLRVQASEMRLKRKQRAEEQAHKVPVKIVFPLIVCILPAFFVVIVGPGVIRIATMLMGMLR